MDETGLGATGVEEGANQRDAYVDGYMGESGKECTGYFQYCEVSGTSVQRALQDHHNLSPATGLLKQGLQVSYSEI